MVTFPIESLTNFIFSGPFIPLRFHPGDGDPHGEPHAGATQIWPQQKKVGKERKKKCNTSILDALKHV